MGDRFVRGFLSGLIAGLLAFIYSLLAVYFKWTTIRWANFISILMFGRNFKSLQEEIFAITITFFFLGLMGVIFSYLLGKLSSNYYLLKSLIFSLTIWFFGFSCAVVFRLPGFQNIPFKSTVSNFIEAIIWGIALGYIIKWLNSKGKTTT